MHPCHMQHAHNTPVNAKDADSCAVTRPVAAARTRKHQEQRAVRLALTASQHMSRGSGGGAGGSGNGSGSGRGLYKVQAHGPIRYQSGQTQCERRPPLRCGSGVRRCWYWVLGGEGGGGGARQLAQASEGSQCLALREGLCWLASQISTKRRCLTVEARRQRYQL